jgi:hypothetical protein
MAALPDLHCRYAATPDVLAQRLDDEVVVVNLRTDRIFALNDTAGRLWELLAAGHTTAEAQELLLAEYGDVTPEQVAAETVATLGTWLAEDLVHAL